MIKNKLIIATLLGTTVGLGAATVRATIVKADTVKTDIKPMSNVEAVEAVNSLIDELIAAENGDINEFRRLVNKFHDAVNQTERIGVGQGTVDSLRMKDNGWKRRLAQKETAIINAKKNATNVSNAVPVKPIVNKNEDKPIKNEKANEKKNNSTTLKTENKKVNSKNTTVKENVESKNIEIKNDMKKKVEDNKDIIANASDKKIVRTGSNIGTKAIFTLGALLATVGAVLKIRK